MRDPSLGKKIEDAESKAIALREEFERIKSAKLARALLEKPSGNFIEGGVEIAPPSLPGRKEKS